MAEKKKLGRGLSALLGEQNEDYAKLDRVRMSKPVAVELLHPGKYQPRHHVDEAAIDALAQSIKEKGVLQPLLVRRHPTDPSAFEIIAGERRWRAAQKAQLHEVPVIIKDFDDQTTLEVALIENVQRLLALDAKVKQLVEQGLLSAGHARTLIGVEGAYEKAKQIIDKALSVREAEKLARQSSSKTTKSKSHAKPKDIDTIALERDLSNALGLKVVIDGTGAKGSLKIAYDNLDQLDAVIAMLRGEGTVDHAPDSDAVAEDDVTEIPRDTGPKLSVSLKPKSATQS